MAIEPEVPISERGVIPPTATERKVVPGPDASSTRSSQPEVSELVEPRSRQSCAWKWLRERSGVDTAGTAATLPAVMSDCSGASAGWSPKPRAVSSAMSDDWRTATCGRDATRAGSVVGTRSESPSIPPRRKITTSVPTAEPSAAAAYETRLVTSCEPRAATPTPSPALRKVRRLKPPAHCESRSSAASCWATAAARIAASRRVGPRRSQSGQSGCSDLRISLSGVLVLMSGPSSQRSWK